MYIIKDAAGEEVAIITTAESAFMAFNGAVDDGFEGTLVECSAITGFQDEVIAYSHPVDEDAVIKAVAMLRNAVKGK